METLAVQQAGDESQYSSSGIFSLKPALTLLTFV